MAFPCPRCGDRYTQSLPMAYGSGTYVRNWRSRSGYRGTTTSQSLIGNLANPPSKRKLWKPLLCLLLVTLWFAPFYVFAWEQMVGSGPSHVPTSIGDSRREHRGQQTQARQMPSVAENVQSVLIVLAFGATLEALTLWWMVRTIRFNRQIYPELLRDWQLRFMCRQCGTVFYPPDALAPVVTGR